MDLNKISRILCIILTVVGAFAMLGIAGRQDYNQEVLYTMPQEAYEQIVLILGDYAPTEYLHRPSRMSQIQSKAYSSY